MRIVPILTAAAFAFAASCGVANAQATPTGQKSDSQIEQGASTKSKPEKPRKGGTGTKGKKAASDAK